MTSPELKSPEQEPYQQYTGLAVSNLLLGKNSYGEDRYWFHLDFVNGDLSRTENVILKCEATKEISDGIKYGTEVLILGKPISSFRRNPHGKKSKRIYIQAYEVHFPSPK